MATGNARYPVPDSAGGLVRRTTVGVLTAVVAVLVANAAVTGLGLDVGPTGAMSPFTVAPLVTSCVVAGVGGAVVYAGLVRLTDRPVRNFVAVSTGVFVLMLGPVALFAPSLGVTPVGQVVLTIYHVLVAVPLVAAIVGVLGQ